MRLLFATFFLTASLAANGQPEKPDWIQVDELVNNFESEEDFSILANAFIRCSAFSNIMGAIITRDAGEELGNNYFNLSIVQYQLSNMYDALMRIGRGVEVDIEAALQDTSKLESPSYRLMIEKYKGWLEFNYINHGGYLQTTEIQSELQTCKNITEEYQP
ncbi:MAG: hypothetical protein ACE37D_11555 [Pseudomonadales bacterium]